MRQSTKHPYYDDYYKGGKHLQHKNKYKSRLEAKKILHPHSKHMKDN